MPQPARLRLLIGVLVSLLPLVLHAEEAVTKAATLEEKAVADQPAAGDRLSKAEAQSVDPAGDQPLDDPLTCLARTIYWEAKGEPREGMVAVAAVVMNRLADPDFPKTICAVVTQGRETGACQFSWWCDGRPDDVEEPEPYTTAKEIAREALNQQMPDPTEGAINFHLAGQTPDWAASFHKTVQVGQHVFYRKGG